MTDHVLDEAAVQADLANYAFFAIESLPGQFDQRAASSQEALLLLGSSSDVTVNTAQLYLVNKDIDALLLKNTQKDFESAVNIIEKKVDFVSPTTMFALSARAYDLAYEMKR